MKFLNMNLNIWFDIPSKYIEDFCVVVSVAVGISWQRLTDTSSQNFKLLFFLRCDKCDKNVTNVFWRVFFSRPGMPLFSLFVFVPLGFVLKQKVVHCVLSFWLACVMLRSYILMLSQYLWIPSQIEPDVTLCY